MPKVTEAHLEARRNQILDAAWACFARKGYHQTTMQDICHESGLSYGAIYRYFPSKEAILAAINDRSREMGRALVEEARARANGPLDILEIIGQTMFAYFNDPQFETMARVETDIFPELVRNQQLRGKLRQELVFWQTAVAGLLREAKERGQLRVDVDPEALAVLFICAWDGLRHFKLIDPQTFGPERLLGVLQALVSEEMRIEPQEGPAAPGVPWRRGGEGQGEEPSP